MEFEELQFINIWNKEGVPFVEGKMDLTDDGKRKYFTLHDNNYGMSLARLLFLKGFHVTPNRIYIKNIKELDLLLDILREKNPNYKFEYPT